MTAYQPQTSFTYPHILVRPKLSKSGTPPRWFGENPGTYARAGVPRTRPGLCCGALLWRDVIAISDS